MLNDTYAVPSTRQVSTSDKDVWAIDFANVVEEGETVSGASATLVRVQPPYIDTIDDFVILVDVVGTTVEVSWDAAVLTRGQAYELLTVAEITGGVAKTLAIRIEVTS